MARTTKTQQAKKAANAKDPGTITPVKNEPPLAKTPVLHKGQAAVVALPDAPLPDSDQSVLSKLDKMEQEELQKLPKILVPNDLPPVQGRPTGLVGNGMVRFYDNLTKQYGTEKESILKGMIKFAPTRYKKIV